MAARRRRQRPRKSVRQATSRSMRAELQFPVSRVEGLLRQGHGAERLNWRTPVFLTGVLEYLTANILELAGKEAQNHRKVRITPEHVQRVLDNHHLRPLFEKDLDPQLRGRPRSEVDDSWDPEPSETSSTASSSSSRSP